MDRGPHLLPHQAGAALSRVAPKEEPWMSQLVQYEDAPPEVRAVYDEIKAARNIPDVTNFWKAIANHPPTLRRTWDSLREVMGPGALDPLTKELLYLAVSASNGCEYCTASHTAAARAKGMTREMLGEVIAIVAMAAETNRLAETWRVPLDLFYEELP
jgi:AhpD family alkylhydroperoxidase